MKKLKSELISLRRDFHRHPELGFNEFRTGDIVEKYLKDLGIVTKRIAKTGVIGTLDTKKPGKVIAIRADIDALDIEEQNTHEYASVNKGFMHACGHDANTAILLCTAKHIASNLEKFTGVFRFIFQPCEEGEGGALPMIKEGALKDPDVDYIFGLHLKTDLEIGNFGIATGSIMAGICNFKIEVIGNGGHAAGPHNAVDPILVSSSIINNSQSIVSRNLNPFDTGVLTFSTINGGNRTNVIPEIVTMSGTIRAMKSEVLEFMKHRLEELVKNSCTMFGAKSKIEFFPSYIPLVNNEKLATFVKNVALQIVDSTNVVDHRSMGGEDFAYFAKKIPACYFMVGARNEKKGIIYPHHHPKFDIDEDAMYYGLELMIKICETGLAI